MKQSIMVGSITLWVIIFLCCAVVEQGWPTVPNGDFGLMNTLFKPFVTNQSFGLLTLVVGTIANVADYVVAAISILFLWFPAIWTGIYVWFWYLICVPTGIGVVMSIVFIIRGVHSS